MKMPKNKEEKLMKMKKVFKEFKSGELNMGKSPKKVRVPKQAIAIMLSVTGQSKPKKKGMKY